MPQVWQLSATHFSTKTLLHGVIVKDIPITYHSDLGSFKNLAKLLRSYFVRLFRNKEIIIEADKRKIKTTTDINGEFWYVVDFLVKDKVLIYTDEKQPPLKIVQHYPVIFSEKAGQYEVISDIDDTIMVSYSTDLIKRIATVAFKSPQKRRTIDYTSQLFRDLIKQGSRMFYVSKSESNLFGMISSFLDHHNFPKGDIFLTPYLKFNQLFRPKKDKSYKEKTISFIITNSNKKFILVGDDSQKDMEAYAIIVKKFPERVFRIYIRQTKRFRSKQQLHKWQELKAAGANVVYFNESDVFDENSLTIELTNRL